MMSVFAVAVMACGGDDGTADNADVGTTDEGATDEGATDEGATDEGATDGAPELADIVDTAVAAGSFETLVTAVKAAELVDTLKGEGPFTVFAPSDEAFKTLPQEVLDAALADPKGLLTDVLTYHVVAGKVMAADVVALTSATTVNGKDISIRVEGDSVILNDTVKVTQTDIECSNGVIHVIDAVLLPPSDEEPELADIVDTAVAAGAFETLVTAVKAAELVDTLKGEGPFTVFAPSDEAFKTLPQDVLDAALADPKGLLTDVLTYHVVSGKVMAADVVGLSSATTVNGKDIAIKVEGDAVFLNDTVQVVQTDIECTNGVIHVIDAVLLPPSE
jgi:uncharacterized surface protein with fasciclin (FAS1) repeats